MSCTCKIRKSSEVIKHSNLLQIDIDKINNVLELKAKLIQDKYTLFSFISLSGNGLKLGIKIDGNKHLQSFLSAQRYYKANYQVDIDKSCKDIVRLCFISHDTELFINENSEVFQVDEAPDIISNDSIKPDVVLNDTIDTRANRDSFDFFEQAVLTAKKMLAVPKGYRHDARLRAGQLLGGYVASGNYSKQQAFNAIISDVLANTDNSTLATKDILDAIDNGINSPVDLNLEQNKRQEFLNSKFDGIICNNCSQKIYFKNKKPFNDKDCTQKHNCLLNAVVKNTEDKFDYSKLPFCFWFEKYERGLKLKIIKTALLALLKEHGFSKFYTNKDTKDTQYIKIKKNKIGLVNINEMKTFILKMIEKLPDIISQNFSKEDLKEKFLEGIDVYICEGKLNDLDIIDLKFLRDSQDTSYHFFKNGFVEVTKENIELKDYKDLPGFIWQSQIIDRNFSYQYDFENSDFYKFCQNICTQKIDSTSYGEPVEVTKFDARRFESLKTVIGKILHNYSVAANQKAIILCESAFNFGDKPEGGAGKGILLQAFGQLRKTTTINGKALKKDNQQFWFQKVELDTQIVGIDDVEKNFDYKTLFHHTSEGITTEKKNKESVKRPVEENSQIVITTNYPPKEVSGSFNRRFFFFELLNYYNEKYLPEQDFRFLFSQDWQDIDWNLFYSFMFECVKAFLQNNSKILDFTSETLEIKRKIAAIGEDVFQYLETLEINIQLNKDDVFKEFKENYTSNKALANKNVFGRKFNEYCEFKKYNLEDGKKRENGKTIHYYIISNIDKNS